MNDFFNSLSDGLRELDLSLHKTKLKDTFVDNFIHELRDYLAKSDVTYRLSKLPKDRFIKLQLQDDGLYHVVRRAELPHTHDS